MGWWLRNACFRKLPDNDVQERKKGWKKERKKERKEKKKRKKEI